MTKRTLDFAALNIVISPPHRPDRYIELFQAAYRLRQPVPLRGDYVGLLGSCRVEKGKADGATILSGQLYKFFELDRAAGWFNIAAHKPAEDDELATIRIPDNLKPHFQVLDYVFVPKGHRLIYVSRDRKESISPRQAQKFFNLLLNHSSLLERFGNVEVTVEPAREALERILAIKRLTRLTIEVNPPNPDDHQEAEQRLFKLLSEQRADRLRTELHSTHKSGLSLNEETKQLAKVAQSNGYVEGHGQTADGKTVDVSTEDHPLIEKAILDESVQTRSALLLEVARSLVSRLL